MSVSFKTMTEFFRQIEADQVSHSDKTYLAHAIGVYNDLRAWGADEDVCNAGLFHSIYGTEIFQSFTLPVTRRDEVRELIGDEAEGLAFWNCFMDRSSFDRHLAGSGPYVLRHRETGEHRWTPGAHLSFRSIGPRSQPIGIVKQNILSFAASTPGEKSLTQVNMEDCFEASIRIRAS